MKENIKDSEEFINKTKNNENKKNSNFDMSDMYLSLPVLFNLCMLK